LDIVLVLVQDRCMISTNIPKAHKSF
jgi:hypothetical protein